MSAADGEGFAIDPTVVRAWKRYPAYKDSGVEWLGEVPAGWDLVRLKYAVRMITERTTDQNSNSNYIGLENIESWTGRLIAGDTLDPEGQSGSFESGDVLFGKLRPYLAKVHKATVDGMCSTEILVLRPKLVSKDYLFYYLLNSEFIKTVNSSTYGTKMPRANWDFIGNLLIPDISLHDQSAIAAFLDRETARLDALIEKKQRFIELLEEKRQAVISHAVTKGLDPNAEMKDSGIEWLGKIPKHWDVMRGRFLFRQLELPPEFSDGVVTAFRDGQVTLRENRRTDGFTIAIKELGYQGVRKGDLVIHSMDGFAGAIGVSESDGKCTGEYVVCDPIQECNNHYFAACLRLMAIRGYIHAFCPSVRQRAPRFRFVRFKDVLLPVPSYDEQSEIVNRITEATKGLNELIEKNQKFIQMLLEYRTALISAAVTGKIDVRGETPAVP